MTLYLLIVTLLFACLLWSASGRLGKISATGAGTEDLLVTLFLTLFFFGMFLWGSWLFVSHLSRF